MDDDPSAFAFDDVSLSDNIRFDSYLRKMTRAHWTNDVSPVWGGKVVWRALAERLRFFLCSRLQATRCWCRFGSSINVCD